MDSAAVLSTVLGSGLLAAVVAGLVAYYTNERRISVENITKERTKWRDGIRSKASEFESAFREGNIDRLRDLRAAFRLVLNPEDHEDEAILEVIDKLLAGEDTDTVELQDRLSLLLKYDWERAKREAMPFWRRFQTEPERTPYLRYATGANKPVERTR